ncbi:hypothetical protein H3C61_01215 [Candidatus Gracilibacteria bacterium]|nr:hypothetical protein [Candidatus Gracilibacteria bacterium]
MNLFLNTISKIGKIILFDNDKNIIFSKDIEVLGNESTLLINQLDIFLKENNTFYSDLENIVVVNGPGSFTGVRTTTLMVNTINFVNKKNITPINYFELFDNYPIIKTSSKRDSFVVFSKNGEVLVMLNDEIEKKLENIKSYYGDLKIDGKINIEDIDYEKIIKNIVLKKEEIIKPFYVKKPSIS